MSSVWYDAHGSQIHMYHFLRLPFWHSLLVAASRFLLEASRFLFLGYEMPKGKGGSGVVTSGHSHTGTPSSIVLGLAIS